jgi:hypothetical protein
MVMGKVLRRTRERKFIIGKKPPFVAIPRGDTSDRTNLNYIIFSPTFSVNIVVVDFILIFR